MQFVDRTLLRLTDPAERAEIFTPQLGDRVFGAAFVVHHAEVGQVTGVSVRDLELLPAPPALHHIDLMAQHPVTGDRWDVAASMLAPRPAAAAHARLELQLTMETRIAETTVERVEVESLRNLAETAAVDARILADDGTVPADPAALSTRRFEALKTMLHERFSEPVDVDLLLARRDIDSFDELVDVFSGTHHTSRVEMELVIDGTLPSRIENHRVVAAAVVDDDPVGHLLELVEQIQVGRDVLARASETATAPTGMTPRVGLPFIVLFPESSLDDDDLPVPVGVNPTTDAARRTARLTELQARLTPFGIALATAP